MRLLLEPQAAKLVSDVSRRARGTIQIASRALPIRAVHTRSEPTKAAVDRAYLKKYGLPGGYSVRNAFMGSIEAAFRAGTPVATSAAILSTAVAPAKVAGSVGFTA